MYGVQDGGWRYRENQQAYPAALANNPIIMAICPAYEYEYACSKKCTEACQC